jgi:hypothetical protein
MTIASDIGTRAFREGNLIAVGTSPTAAEAAEALYLLNNLMYSLIGDIFGENLSDWSLPPANTSPVDARYPLDPLDEALPTTVYPYPPQNSRLVVKITAATTVYLPPSPNDGARLAIADAGSTAAITLTINANGRQIEDAATLGVVPATTTAREWLYRADTANWVRIADLVAGDTPPFPAVFDDLLITGLAIRLASRYGLEPRSGTTEIFKAMLNKAKTRYAQPQRQVISEDAPGLSTAYPSYSTDNLFA